MKFIVSCVLAFFVICVPVFALTPKEQKGVKTLKADTIEYLSPAWFTPFSLQDAPEDLPYRIRLLPEQDRDEALYIVMPTLGLITPVVIVPEDSLDYAIMQEGGEIDINAYLVDGVMHYPGTPLPDQEGNIVIFGHSNFYKNKPGRYKSIFADIMNIDVLPTDEIWLYEKQDSGTYELYKYRVEKSYDTVPTDVAILEPHGGKELTVFACTNGLAGRRILRSTQLPDTEMLVPSRTKVRVRNLMERFANLSPEQQQQIIPIIADRIAATRKKLPSTGLHVQQKMRKYLLRWLESEVLK